VPWLGTVPAHWEVKPIKYLASCNDEVLPETTDPDAEFRYIEISDVDETQGVTKTQTVIFRDAPSRARRVVRAGDIIISTVRTYLKAITKIDDTLAAAVASTGFAVLRPYPEVNASFLAFAMMAPHFLDRVVAHSVGISYPAINAADLMGLSLPLPPLAEQRAIAAFLDAETARIDTLMAKQEALIATLQEKRRAVISHAVTKGLDPAAPMKDSGVPWLGAVPAHWEVKPIKYLVKMESGGTPDKSKADYWDGAIPWASAKDLKVDLLYDTEDHITQYALDSGAASLVAEESVIIVVRGMILLHTLPVSVNLVPVAINQDLKALHPNSNRLDWKY
jgi:type I restriction enzyme S subunit